MLEDNLTSMNTLTQKQAYTLAGATVLGATVGIILFGNKKPYKNPFDLTGPTPKFVAKSVAGEDEEEDLQRHLKDIRFSDKINFPKKFIPKMVAGEDEEEDLKRHLKDIYNSEKKNEN